MTDWNFNMDEAPKDGTLIDVWHGGEFPGRTTNVSWREPTDSEWWVHGGDTLNDTSAGWFDPFGPMGKYHPIVAWMPLPEAPSHD